MCVFTGKDHQAWVESTAYTTNIVFLLRQVYPFLANSITNPRGEDTTDIPLAMGRDPGTD